MQIDLSPGTPVQAHVTGAQAMDELPANSHFLIFAIQEDATQSRLFEIARFELHRIVDVTSPCFIDTGEHVLHQGLHVSQYAVKIGEDTRIADYRNPPPDATEEQKLLMGTAVQRMANVQLLGGPAGIKVVTSASTSTYPPVATSCTGPQDQIPPPNCTDEASNQLRLKLCQAAWKADTDLFEGTDRVLTAPLNGVTRGTALGLNPINMAPVGGAQFFVNNALDNIDAYGIYVQPDEPDGIEQLGEPLYFGRPTMVTRGVSHIHLASPRFPQLTAEMAVFADLGQDDVHF